MKISHLVVNGCSFTYGQGLTDPIKYAWPTLLAKKLGVPSVNLAIPGIGMDGIYRRTYQYFYKDIMHSNHPFYIHAYTQSQRREIYHSLTPEGNVGQEFRILGTQNSPADRYLINNTDLYCLQQLELKKHMIWNSITSLLDVHKVPHLHTNQMDSERDVEIWLLENYPALFNSNYRHVDKVEDLYKITKHLEKTECLHETPDGHKLIADFLYDEIISRNDSIEIVNSEYSTLEDIHTVSQERLILESTGWTAFEWQLNCYYMAEQGIDYMAEENQYWVGSEVLKNKQ